MTKILIKQELMSIFSRDLDIGYWNLFGAWNLVIGI
jgi:hypothetical protein